MLSGCVPAFQETQKLQKEQAWYQQNQMNMLKDDEVAYLAYYSQAMFRIHVHILELHLNRLGHYQYMFWCSILFEHYSMFSLNYLAKWYWYQDVNESHVNIMHIE